MPEIPISGVRSQLLPEHGALSTKSLAPAANTVVVLASIARAGSLTAFGRYGVVGPATETLASAVWARASGGKTKTAVTATSSTSKTRRGPGITAPSLSGRRKRSITRGRGESSPPSDPTVACPRRDPKPDPRQALTTSRARHPSLPPADSLFLRRRRGRARAKHAEPRCRFEARLSGKGGGIAV